MSRLSVQQLSRACALWKAGNDTVDIARQINSERVPSDWIVTETAVANSLGTWRDEQWKAKRTAA